MNSPRQKVFSSKHKRLIALSSGVSALLGGVGSHYGYVSMVQVTHELLNASLVLFGFIFTSLSLIGSVIGTPLLRRLQDARSYYSLLTNISWLLRLLFFNIVFGWFFLIVEYEHYQHIIFDTLIVFDLAIVMSFTWIASTRFVKIMEHLKADVGDREESGKD